MKKNKIAELLVGIEFTNEEFQEALDSLPDEFAGKSLKANIRKYFKLDGTAKVKKQIGQEWHNTQGFIRRQMGTQIHINRLRKHVEAHKQLIKEKKTRTHKVEKYGKIVRVKEDKISQAQPQAIINPIVLRNQLVVEYNRLIREGIPDTKKLREQIHDQIQKIEEAESHVAD